MIKDTNGYLELDPADMSDRDIQDEVNRRTAKAGYTTRNGECCAASRIQTLVTWGKERDWAKQDALHREMFGSLRGHK